MEPETAAKLAAGIAMGVGAIGPGLGIGIAVRGCDGGNRTQSGGRQ